MKQIYSVLLVFIVILNYSLGSENMPNELVKIYNHAIYISVVEIEHQDLSNSAKIKIKVFTDDLVDAIMNAFQTRVEFSKGQTCADNKIVIEGYFDKHFKVTINGKLSSISFNSCELNGDSVWLSFNMDCPTNWKNVSVSADFLMELFPKQSNVVSIYHGNNKRFFRLTLNSITEKITF